MAIKYLLYIFSFVIIIQIGAISTESIRFQFAKEVSYSGEYSKSYGRYIFSSQRMQSEFKQIAAKYNEKREVYTNAPEWEKLIEQDRLNRVKFEIPSKLINILISVLGFLFFLFFKNKKSKFSWSQLFSILLSMEIVRILDTKIS